MKKLLLPCLLGLFMVLMSSSTLSNQESHESSDLNKVSGLYKSIIIENISLMNEEPSTNPERPNPEIPGGTLYKNARNQYCKEPAGAIGCVRAVGRECNLGVFCISPKSNL